MLSSDTSTQTMHNTRHKNSSTCRHTSKNKPFLDDQVDVTERHILDFWLSGQKCDWKKQPLQLDYRDFENRPTQRWSQFPSQWSQMLRVGWQQLHELHQNLHRRQHNSSISMRQTRRNPLTYAVEHMKMKSPQQLNAQSCIPYLWASRSSLGA